MDKRFIEEFRNPPSQYRGAPFWAWNGKLVGRVVPKCVYYLEMAEKYCRKALEIDPNYEKVKPLLICVLYAQYHTAGEVLAASAKVPDALPEKTITGLKARRARLAAIIKTLPALGKKNYYAALQMALDDQQDSVAVSCVDVLKQLGTSRELVPATVARKKP